MRSPSVREVKQALDALGPVLPGSISKQWNVCGKPGCRCKDPDRPQRHGPYYQLSFTAAGLSSTLLLKPEELAVARQCIRRYRRFRELNAQLVRAYVAQARRDGVAALAEVD
ncbi:MAG: hypothetical protein IT514_14540 [Burkholderiales bacterium]|nr:hypothetical protein [Burkholderiales bacterium]